MSKIPYVDPERENPEKQKKKIWNKRFILRLIISFSVITLTAGLIALIEYFSLTAEGVTTPKQLPLHILVDAFGISGVIGIAFFCLNWIATKGAFDMLSYGIQVVFLTTFRPKYRETNFPKTFYDYKVLKNSKPRTPLMALLFVSLLFLLTGIILLIIKMNY